MNLENIMLHVSERQNSETLTPPTASENVQPQDLSLIAGGNARWQSHFGK